MRQLTLYTAYTSWSRVNPLPACSELGKPAFFLPLSGPHLVKPVLRLISSFDSFLFRYGRLLSSLGIPGISSIE